MSSKALRVLCIGTLLWTATTGLTQSPWLVPYGTGSCGSDFVPTWHTAGEMPVIGNTGFQLVSENLISGTPCFVLLSTAPANLPFLGMTLYANPSLSIGLATQVGGTGGPGSGTLNLPLPIPNNAALVGGKLFIQGFFFDASVAPSSLVHTHGLGVTIAQSISPYVAVIRDRLKYQAFFTGASQTPDQIGRAIWIANQVPGFTYVKTAQFTCGGESHWMVIVLHAQTGLEFCLIPGGSFRMGDINGTGTSYERPVHLVHIKPILLARTEVPQSTWQNVMGSNPSRFQGTDFPVDSVDWHSASAFCAKAFLRLPSDSEWEFACRAGVEACFYFGSIYIFPGPPNMGNYAWYNANSGKCTHSVGGKLPNAFGLFDMHGNVNEWVEDGVYSESKWNYSCAPTDGGAWTGPSKYRIGRSGCYGDYPGTCRSSDHFSREPSSTVYSYHWGFRPACSLR